MIDCESMALRIEQECYRQGMSIHEMLRYAGLNYRNLQNIRIAKRGPTAEIVEKICKALGKDPNWLHGWKEEQP